MAEVQAQGGYGLAKSWLKVKAVLVVDVSSSMEARTDNERRVDVARREVAKIQRRQPGQLAIVSFSYDASWDPSGRLPEPSGSTNLAGALEYTRELLGRALRGSRSSSSATATRTARSARSRRPAC